jgi:hypothetical protein
LRATEALIVRPPSNQSDLAPSLPLRAHPRPRGAGTAQATLCLSSRQRAGASGRNCVGAATVGGDRVSEIWAAGGGGIGEICGTDPDAVAIGLRAGGAAACDGDAEIRRRMSFSAA